MGFTGAAFGICLGNDHPGIYEILRFIAKKVKYYNGTTGELIVELYGFEKFDYAYYCSGKYFDISIKFEPYDDIECDDTSIEVLEDNPSNEFKLKNYPGLKIGNPTSCGTMIYVAECEGGDSNVSIEALQQLMQVYRQFHGTTRMSKKAILALKVNCCS